MTVRARKFLVVGLGNPLMSDEGIGIRILEQISREAADFPDVDFLDLGTGGMNLLHAMDGRDAVLIVDCAKMGEAPGTVRCFRPDEVRTRKEMASVSLHEADPVSLLDLAGRIGMTRPNVRIIGIQPKSIAPGDSLSPELAARMDEYTEAVRREIRMFVSRLLKPPRNS